MIQSRAILRVWLDVTPETHDDRSDWVHWSQFPEYECPTSDDEQEEIVDVAFADTGRSVERAQISDDDTDEMGDGDDITVHVEQPEPSSLPSSSLPSAPLPDDSDLAAGDHDTSDESGVDEAFFDALLDRDDDHGGLDGGLVDIDSCVSFFTMESETHSPIGHIMPADL